ncbi:MAG: YraN family protein [Candidatus Coproplasma sp.]
MAIKGQNRKLGFWGERRAARFLKKSGYQILCRNFKCKAGEIDIIARRGEVIAFIEVKTRTSDCFGEPNEAVDCTRRRRYVNAARQYLYINRIRPDGFTLRFDIIEIAKGEINHIESAFEWE